MHFEGEIKRVASLLDVVDLLEPSSRSIIIFPLPMSESLKQSMNQQIELNKVLLPFDMPVRATISLFLYLAIIFARLLT